LGVAVSEGVSGVFFLLVFAILFFEVSLCEFWNVND
jgi:hypothetical protein